jgi:hypothetical protein
MFMCGYLQVWVAYVAPKDFWMGSGRRMLDHLRPKLTNNKQNLVKVYVNYLSGPPKRLVHHPKSLIVPNNMKEYHNLFLNTNTSIVMQKPPGSKFSHRQKNVSSSFLT